MDSPKFYTGVGSRETPDLVRRYMTWLGERLAKNGWILRSGGAEGADKSFETGCHFGKEDSCEIYLPWKGFNNNDSPLYSIGQPALQLAASVHPAWAYCSPAVKKFHARNCYQVLGLTLDSPSRFLVCWTKGGKRVGGTATALALAERQEIPIFNFGNEGDPRVTYEKVIDFALNSPWVFGGNDTDSSVTNGPEDDG